MKIAICTLYTPDFEDFAKYTTLNIRNYCNMHGYDYIEQTEKFMDLSPKYPHIHWNKYLLLKKVLNTYNTDHSNDLSLTKVDHSNKLIPKYDWVIWMDCDVVITNKNIRFEDIINDTSFNKSSDVFTVGTTSETVIKAIQADQTDKINANKQSIIGLQTLLYNNINNNEIDIIVTKEESGCYVINPGIMLVRNSEWSRKFLDDWFNKGELPNALWRDQDTFHYFYITSEEVRSHIKVLKQKVMNSFPNIFTDGDFILHYAGRDRRDLRRLAYYNEQNYVSKRDEIPKLLNKLQLNGEAIEIGVQRGLYSEIILNNSNLKKLHLCDPWRRQNDKTYRDVANVSNDDQDKIFTEIENKFRNTSGNNYSNRTDILRIASSEAIKLFKDESLDFAYIDANHSYEYVLEDIKRWYPKVKNGGIIAGHDYLDGELPEANFGVKSAVIEFFGNKDHIYVTDEDWPSWYVIKNSVIKNNNKVSSIDNIQLINVKEEITKTGSLPITVHEHLIITTGPILEDRFSEDKFMNNNKLRVALISTPFFGCPPIGYGGLEAIVWDLAEGLDKLGHTVTLFAPEGSRKPKHGNLITTGPALDTVHVDWFQAEKNNYEIYKQYINSQNFDVIDGHDWFGYEYLLKLSNPKLRVTHQQHGGFSWDSIPPVPKPNLVVLSKFMRDYTISYFKQKGYNVDCHFCYNGVDLDFYKYDPSIKRTNRLLYVGRFSRFKGPHDAITLAKKVNLPIDLIGAAKFIDDPNYLKEIESMCNNDNIVMYKDATNEFKLRKMQEAKCLIFPSRMGEPFGLGIIQAMATDCPVIAFNDGAVKEIITPETGFVCDSVDEMTNAISKIYTIKAENCRKRAEFFSKENMAKNKEKLYRDIISGNEW